jgi:hypothetical protein
VFELFFLVGLVALVVWLISGKKAVVFENPVVIQKVGFYHATIAPQLVQSEYLIVEITRQFLQSDQSDVATQCFELHDAGIYYLMAVTLRAGVLYFQVTGHTTEGVNGLRRFSEQVLLHHPLTLPLSEPVALIDAVHAVARSLNIDCRNLQ